MALEGPAPSSSTDHPSIPVVLKTVGWTWLDRVWQLIVIAAFPVAVLFIIYLSGPRPPTDVVPRLIGIIVFLAVVDLFVEAIVSVREIRVDSNGVTFGFIFHSEHRDWRDLEPSRQLPGHGGWGVISRRRGNRSSRQRGYSLTIEQSRVLLSYPSCPKWELSPSIREGLGLAPVPS